MVLVGGSLSEVNVWTNRLQKMPIGIYKLAQSENKVLVEYFYGDSGNLE